MAKIVGFFGVQIDGVVYKDVKGVMYAKPTPETVLASLYVPNSTDIPRFHPEKWITLSATCEGLSSIRGVKAWVDHYVQLPGTGKYYTVIMYRKGKEPPESEVGV
ncbi:MAG: hypothetical protein LUC93_03270 [Planctomycetaceae bacterium]|nr:hypothetical protein [Planctomycetaceae bacterium]